MPVKFIGLKAGNLGHCPIDIDYTAVEIGHRNTFCNAVHDAGKGGGLKTEGLIF